MVDKTEGEKGRTKSDIRWGRGEKFRILRKATGGQLIFHEANAVFPMSRLVMDIPQSCMNRLFFEPEFVMMKDSQNENSNSREKRVQEGNDPEKIKEARDFSFSSTRERKRKKKKEEDGEGKRETKPERGEGILFYSRIIEYEREGGRKRVIFQARIAEYRRGSAMAAPLSRAESIRRPPSGLPRGKLNIRAPPPRQPLETFLDSPPPPVTSNVSSIDGYPPSLLPQILFTLHFSILSWIDDSDDSSRFWRIMDRGKILFDFFYSSLDSTLD